MKSAEYWKKRFAMMENDRHLQSEDVAKELETHFERARIEIQDDIEKWYYRLAENNDISYRAAKEFLKADELKEFHWSLEEYIKYGKENAINQKWIKELENASAKVHINKLEALKIQTQQAAESVYQKVYGSTKKAMQQSYQDSYYHTAFEIAKGRGIGVQLGTLDKKAVENAVSKPWANDGASFSDRIWTQKEKMIQSLHSELTNCIIRGEHPEQAARLISKKLDVGTYQAKRLVYTESAALASSAQKDCLINLGVEKYQIVATLDNRTSDICQELDGKVFDMKDYQEGVTAPPFHPCCRSTTCPYDEEDIKDIAQRAARDEDGEVYYVPEDMTYKEWEKNFIQGDKSDLQEISEKGVTESGITNKRIPKVDSYKINRKVIDSSEYKKKFNGITKKSRVDEAIYKYAKAALYHRDGTNMEDLYILSNSTGDILGKNITSTEHFGVPINDSVRKAIINNQGDLIGMHTHFDDTPPTGSDFETAFKRRYNLGVVANATGDIYLYGYGYKYISAKLIDDTIEKYIKLIDENGKKVYTTTKEAHLQALNQLRKDYGIWYEAR